LGDQDPRQDGIMRRSALALFIMLAGSAFSTRADPVDCTRSAFRSAFSSAVKSEELTEAVDFLYYPKAGYYFISHIEVAAKNRVWQTMATVSEKGSLEAAERKAAQGGRAFYRFRIRATPGEVEKFEKILEESKWSCPVKTGPSSRFVFVPSPA